MPAKKTTKASAKTGARKAAKKTTKKAAPKKAATKKAAPKKAATKKAAPKKAAAKKAATKKAAPKNVATKKAATNKAATKKAATKKAASKALAHKDAATTPVTATAAPVIERKPLVRDPALDIAQAVAAVALDKKADDVVILRVTDLTSYADGFVLASAPSERQVQAIARFVDDEMRKAGKAPVSIEGLEQGHWVLVDLGAVVLHVFLSNARRYYDLEGFWSEAPRVDVDERYGLDVLARMRAAADARQSAAV